MSGLYIKLEWTQKATLRVNEEHVISKAREVAGFAHDGQTRKGSNTPFIEHPIAVSEMIIKQGATKEVVAAALLHDVLEDVPPERYSREDMLKDFGSKIVEMVDGVSEVKLDVGGRPRPWVDRKVDYIKRLKEGTDDMVLISLADKVHNLSSFINDYQKMGSSLFKEFKASPTEQYWYYKTLSTEVFVPRLGENNELVAKLQLFIHEFVDMFDIDAGK